MVKNRAWFLWAAALLVSAGGCAPSDTVTIQGCGATFPAPLYQRWFLEFYLAEPDVRVNYQAIGSGAGIQQFSEGLVHFGASDEALKEARLQEIAKKLSDREGHPVEVIQAPLTAGSVAICYNVPGNPNLKLTRKTYVDMLLGEITHWDDPAIAATNPGVALPHLEMTFIRRAESSGTTYVFTNHLNAIDARWTKEKHGPGVGKSVLWPVGIGGKGNAGVSALILQTPGAFGYIEAGYAELSNLPMAALENHAGNFVAPRADAAREALQEAKFNKVLGAEVPDPRGPKAYPIVTFTWVVCRSRYGDPGITAKLKEVLDYCLSMQGGRGQSLSEELGYIPLPDEALARARKAVDEIKLHEAP
jgi:phosphate transport system substrate-binding protein